jgi:hypothetical protein
MRWNRAAAGCFAIALLLVGFSAMPLYGADRLELKKDWQKPSAENQGKSPQARSGGLKLKESWGGSGNVPKSNPGGLKLKDDWTKPSDDRSHGPAAGAGGLKLKNDWKHPETGTEKQGNAPQPKSGGLQLKGDWKNSN